MQRIINLDNSKFFIAICIDVLLTVLEIFLIYSGDILLLIYCKLSL